MATVQIPESAVAKFLFADSRTAWFWLLVRVYVGWEWLTAGWEKLQNPVWAGSKAGVAIQGFLNAALKKTAGDHPDVQGWYGHFISGFAMHHTALLSYL